MTNHFCAQALLALEWVSFRNTEQIQPLPGAKCQVQPCKFCRSVLARLPEAAIPFLRPKCHRFCQLLSPGRKYRDVPVQTSLPGYFILFARARTLEQGHCKVDSGDLDAKSFQNMPSKFTTKVKSLLNVFLRWVSLWEVCLKLSLVQKLAGVSLINEEISHIRIFIACTCVFACVCVWSCLGNEGRKRHEPEHAFPLRNTCAIVKLHPITI